MSASRVLIDGYFLGKPMGYGRFIFELCRAIGNADTGIQFIVAVQRSADKAYLPEYKNIKYEILDDSIFPLWEQLKIPLCAARNRCDLIHFPYNTKSLLTLRRSVTTVHDLTFFLKTKRDWKSALIHFYMRTTFNMSVRNSDAIIAVSDTTRDALRMKSLASTTIYNTVDGFIGAQNPDRLDKPARPYFLHRGSYAANHRNTDRIIEAFLSCPELTEKYDLKILGVPDGARH
ncbi:MAG: glycosyltransferase, partial [Alphaproteobacteria bacterium]|nr:glycosyltransferase [Alphaproteobacteria bacterium]